MLVFRTVVHQLLLWSNMKLSQLLTLGYLSCQTLAQQSPSNNNLTAYTSDTVPVVGKNSTQGDRNYKAPYFPLLGFKEYAHNPILRPNPSNNWESAFLYNPAAIVIDDMVWLLYRAQNDTKVSTIGLAWSHDGYNFTRYKHPVFQPSLPYEVCLSRPPTQWKHD